VRDPWCGRGGHTRTCGALCALDLTPNHAGSRWKLPGLARFTAARHFSRDNGSMELESATEELYRVPPAEFIAARNAMAAEARRAGNPELASSLKKLRKPSVGAWLANVLVLERSSDVERLVDLGADLRAPTRKLEGQQIRRVSKERSDVISKLVRDARSWASRAGQSVSAAAAEDLESTLEAAFSDPRAAENLLEGRLIGGLHYSGLGFGEQTATGSSTATEGSPTSRHRRSEADQLAAERNLEEAHRDADQADAEVTKARQAVAENTRELTRLKSAVALAERRSKAAHARVSAAKAKLGKLR
jgi:hypothetical protein